MLPQPRTFERSRAWTPWACVTCDAEVRSALFTTDFLTFFLTIPVPLVLGGLLVASGMRRWIDRVERMSGVAVRGKLAPVVYAGTLLGLGLGGFLDGILLHQVLQVHQMISNVLPPDTVLAKNVNMFWDGMFHVAAWILTGVGVLALWRTAGRLDVRHSTPVLLASALLGWGAFNVLDSVANHYLFGYHDVVERSARPWAWNLGFLVFGLAQLGGGAAIVRRAARGPR